MSERINSSQVTIKYKFSKPFCSKRFSKDGNHAESEQFLLNNYSVGHFVLILIFKTSPLCPSSLEHVTVEKYRANQLRSPILIHVPGNKTVKLFTQEVILLLYFLLSFH